MTLHVTPFEYSQMHYNEAAEYIERAWNGYKLTKHDWNLMCFAYNIGRTVEVLDKWSEEVIDNGKWSREREVIPNNES